jgi:hypothetical protein
MSQITKTAQVKPIAARDSYGRGITASLALAATLIVVAFLLTRAPAANPVGGGSTDQLTDGFLPGAKAANAARQISHAQALRDGWQTSAFGPMAAGQQGLRDGWESGLVPPAAPGGDITDGWEASLFR